jgi:hypothetical protein
MVEFILKQLKIKMTEQPPKKPTTPPVPPPRQIISSLSREDLKIGNSMLAKLDVITEELILLRKEVLTIKEKNIAEQVAYGILRAMLVSFILAIVLRTVLTTLGGH